MRRKTVIKAGSPAASGGGGGGSGDVTAAASFGTDNVIIRSNGTGKGVQKTGWTINDSDGASASVALSLGTLLALTNTGSGGTVISATASGSAGTGITASSNGGAALSGVNVTAAGYGVLGTASVANGIGVSATQGHASAIAFQIVNAGGFAANFSFAGTANRAIVIPDAAGTMLLNASNLSDVSDAATALANLDGAAESGNNIFTGSNIFNTAPVVLTQDLASTTAIPVGSYYYKSISADLGPLTFSGTPSQGSTIVLHLTVSGTRTVTFPSCYLNGEASSAITTRLCPPGEYLFIFRYSNSKWILSDPIGALYNSTTADPTANDDAADGYVAGRSIWINTSTGRVWICRDSTATAAVWECINREKIAIGIACSDETTAITAGTAKATFRMPFAFTVTDVRASVTTAPTGSTILIDINEAGTTILSTKLMIDASEKTSTTAATPYVLSDTALADDAEITVDFDQVGSSTAGAGVKVWLIGYRSAA